MGIFDLFKGKGGHSDDPLEKINVIPGLQLSRGLAEYWPQIERTKMQSIKIEASPLGSPAMRRSSFGCYPTIPKGFPYPADASGNYLYPLAQICCSDLPVAAGYPDNGYLQFYISSDDDIYGIDFDDPQDQNGFRVLYFEEKEVISPETNFEFLDEVIHSNSTPLNKPHSILFSLQDDYLGSAEKAESENLAPILAAIRKEYPNLADEFEGELYDTFRSSGHKMGGYAYFTQSDPRLNSKTIEHFQLLFQMDSDHEIMWGDVGVGNFFIDPADLASKDFSKVLYNWDCS